MFWGPGRIRARRPRSLGVDVFIVATFGLKLPGLSRARPLMAWGLVTFSPGKRFSKGAFDRVVGTVGTVVGMPLWLLAALANKLDSRGRSSASNNASGRLAMSSACTSSVRWEPWGVARAQ